MSTIEFTQLQKFKNGMVSGSFVTVGKKPVTMILRDVVLPFGIQDYDGKESVTVQLTQVPRELSDVYTASVNQFPGIELKNPVNNTEKYGPQIRIGLNHASSLWEQDKKPCDRAMFMTRVRVDICF